VSRQIIHVDMDAFYASVEERENPALRGKPIVVAGKADSRGVVSAANYAARKFGVFSAMPTANAQRLCRDLIILPVRMSLYQEVSRQIHNVFQRYTPHIEPLSLDEAFLDPIGGERLHGNAVSTARQIKDDILAEVKLIASVGVGPNKFIAKLASDCDKPDGFTVVEERNVIEFLNTLALKRIWGVGPSTLRKLNSIGIYTVSELRKASYDYLTRHLGKTGPHLWHLARGQDDRPVKSENHAKSVSHETTFADDIDDWNRLESVLMQLTESVCARLRKQDLAGRTITIKLRDSSFRTYTVSNTIAIATQSTDAVWSVVQNIIQTHPRRGTPIRLVGVGLSHFDSDDTSQLDVFATGAQAPQSSLDQLTDTVADRFGKFSLRRAKGLLKK